MQVISSLVLVLALLSTARPAAAEPSDEPSGLRSPDQRSLRYSAYTLPKGMWAFEGGLLGVTSEELYGSLGVKYGLPAGLELDINLAHYAVGVFNLSARWNFLELSRFALAANVDFTYGHGAWMWIVGPLAKQVLQDTDLISIPFGLTASAAVLDWLQLDLGVSYRYATVFGTLGEGGNFYANAEIGARQVLLRPGARLFVSDATALEFGFDLPVYTWVPIEGEITAELRNRGFERSGSGGATVSLSETWKFETGVRSRLAPWLFCTLRIHYGRANKLLYSTTIGPSMSLEFRL
jgi:hypothetical protein